MASSSMDSREHAGPHRIHLLILGSEWGSSKGGLSTINRELAINVAKCPQVQVTFFVPQCNGEEKRAALNHDIDLREAKRVPGMNELQWLCFPPDDLPIDVVVGHGVKLGPQAAVIRRSRGCKWLQVVHTAPEELAMHKKYPNPVSSGEKKHQIEVELSELADAVVTIGPKLHETFRSYLCSCKNYEKVFNFTPGIFSELSGVEQKLDKEGKFRVLLFGRGDAEDFELKGFDIAAKAVSLLSNTLLVFVGAADEKEKHEVLTNRFLEHGIPAERLTVRGFITNLEDFKRVFCEVDLAVMPSRTEGFGLTGLEALSAGLPVLVSQNSGFGEALSRVPFGSFFVVDSNDAQVWASKIKSISVKDRKRRLKEAEELRISYKREYCWKEQSKELVGKTVNMIHDVSIDCQRQTRQKIQESDITGQFRGNDPSELRVEQQRVSKPQKRQLRTEEKDITVPGEQPTNKREQLIKRIIDLKSELRAKKKEEKLIGELWTELLQEKSNDNLTLHGQVTALQGELRLMKEEMRGQLAESQGQEERLRQNEQQIAELERQLRMKEELVQGKDSDIETLQQHVAELQRTLHEECQQRVTSHELQSHLKAKKREQSAEMEKQRDQQPCETGKERTLASYQRGWVVNRNDIQITDQLLGSGAWGIVFRGKYHGCDVAVKQLHEVIMSHHNRRLFQQEIEIASQCRHPCLLQFIGATLDDRPLLITEMMDCSLRQRLYPTKSNGHYPLPATEEVLVFSLDVARALNYLHHTEPTPIIHNDVSSSNVLLWQRRNQWRAKLSDYGSANFVRQSDIHCGSFIYSAPESITKDPDRKISCKVDVFSYGVLLCEMLTGQMPDPNQRERQISQIDDRVFGALSTSCVERDPWMRPNMDTIIEELERFQVENAEEASEQEALYGWSTVCRCIPWTLVLVVTFATIFYLI